MLEETHYYPFGLTIAGLSTKALKPYYAENRKKFNGIEHTTDLDLDTYDAFYRNYDPQIGRWWQIDPEAECLDSYSPYEGMGNNPIINVDPLGDFKTRFGAWIHKIFHGGGSVGQNKYGEYYVLKTKSVSDGGNGSVVVTGSVAYGRGRDQYSSAREKLASQYEEQQQIDEWTRQGIWDPNLDADQARRNLIGISVGSALPNAIIKPATIAINAPKIQQVEKIIEKIKIQFGKGANQVYHAFRHTDEMGLSRAAVQAAIEEHLPTVASQIVDGKPLNQVIEVSGKQIQYTAFKLPDGTINVGRIHEAN